MATVDVRIGEGEAHLIRKSIELGRAIERGEQEDPGDDWLRAAFQFAFPDEEHGKDPNT